MLGNRKVEEIRRRSRCQRCKERVRTSTPLSPSTRHSRSVARRRPDSAEFAKAERAHTSKRQKVRCFRRNAAPDSDTAREQTSESRRARTKQSKAKQRRSKNQLVKDKIQGPCERNGKRERHRLIEILFATLLSGTTKQNSAHDLSRLGLLRSSTARRSPSKSKRAKLLVAHTPGLAGSCFVCLRSRPAASRGALCRCCKRRALAWTSQ